METILNGFNQVEESFDGMKDNMQCVPMRAPALIRGIEWVLRGAMRLRPRSTKPRFTSFDHGSLLY